MGWRFRRSVKILPGVRLNFGKNGFTSTTIGGRGFKTNVSSRGVKHTIGIPGTGISYQTPTYRSTQPDSNIDGSGSSSRIGLFAIVGFVGAFFISLVVVGILMSRTRDTSAPNYSTTPSYQEVTGPPPPVTLKTQPDTSPKPVRNPSAKKTAVVITENANLRGFANSGSQVIQTIGLGTTLEIIKQAGPWFLIRYEGGTGWIHGNTIRLTDSENSVSSGSTPDNNWESNYGGDSYSRSPYSSSSSSVYSGHKDVHVNGYFRKNGTYVHSYNRRSPR
jgi:hypothetical protein